MSNSPPDATRTKRYGTLLFALGLALILWGVFHVLNAVSGDMTWPVKFAERKSYNQTKTAVHGAFLGGFVRALGGLATAAWGLRLRGRAAGGPGEGA